MRTAPVTLDPWNLPGYALRTILRMFAALAARNRRAEQLIVPALDILQSVPILGFLTFTVTSFMGRTWDGNWGLRGMTSSSEARPR